jgi:hypothetical protein
MCGQNVLEDNRAARTFLFDSAESIAFDAPVRPGVTYGVKFQTLGMLDAEGLFYASRRVLWLREWGNDEMQ